MIAQALGATFTHTVAPLPMRFATPQAAAPIEHGTLPQGWWIELQGQTLRVGTTEPAEAQMLLDALRRANVSIRRFQPVRPSLEDLFIDALADQGTSARPGARIGK